MSVIFMTIAISFVIALFFLAGFLWSIKSGQYDDTEGPSVRMLFEDKPKKKHVTNNK